MSILLKNSEITTQQAVILQETQKQKNTGL